MGKVVTFGEVLMRLSPSENRKLRQSHQLEFFFGGTEMNVASSLSYFGMNTQQITNVSADDDNLYVITKIVDSAISSTSENIQNNDGTVIYLDSSNKNYVKPDKGVFKIIVSAANKVQVIEGKNSEWIETEMLEIKIAVTSTHGYVQEIAIPWNSIGGKPNSNSQIGFTIELIEKGNSSYSEMISTTQANAPYTWLSLKL